MAEYRLARGPHLPQQLQITLGRYFRQALGHGAAHGHPRPHKFTGPRRKKRERIIGPLQGRDGEGQQVEDALHALLLQGQSLLGVVLHVHVGAGPKPAPHLPAGPPLSHHMYEKPAVLARRIPQPKLHLKRLPRVQGLAPELVQGRQIIGMNEGRPQRQAGGLVEARHVVARVVDEALVGVVGAARGIGGPNKLRQVLGQKAELLAALLDSGRSEH